MNCRIILFFFILLSISCSEKFDNSKLSIFKYNESNGVSSLDPAYSKDKATIWVTSQIFNSLVKMDVNLNVVPSVSKNWNISDNGLVYTFYLKNDVFFHNSHHFKNGKGRKVIASDFVYSFDRLLSKKMATPGRWVFDNVSDYYSLNDSTLQIKLKNVSSSFLSLLSMQYCSVVPKECAINNDFRSNPVGTGPFQFQIWKEGVKLVLRKNPDYFEFEDDVRLPYLDAISITFIRDKQSEFLSFLQSNIDFVSGLDPSYIDEILNSNGILKDKYTEKINLQSIPFLNTEYLAFKMDGFTESAKNIYLRRAIHQCINKKKMIKYLRNNIGTVAENGFVPMGISSFSNSVIGYSYDLEKAKINLEKAGFPEGLGLETIILNTTSAYLDLCEFIQSELKNIGIKLKIEVNPPSTHRQMMANSEIDFFRGSWIADYPDAENYLSLFYSKNFCPNGPNYTHFYNKKYDEIYESAIKENDKKIRHNIYNKLDQIIMENAVVIPLYYDQILRLSHINISGLSSNSQNNLDLTKVIKN